MFRTVIARPKAEAIQKHSASFWIATAAKTASR
jgi:hypothetical protein